MDKNNMEQQTIHTGVVIVAGGTGSRMGGNLPKQFMLLDGQPILARTINNFAEALPAAEIVVVLPADYIDFWNDYARRFPVATHRTAAGGLHGPREESPVCRQERIVEMIAAERHVVRQNVDSVETR